MAMTRRTRLWLTIFLGVMTAIAPLSTDMYLPALPEVQEAFSVPTSLVQMTLTMTTLGMALGQILAGPLSDLLGRRRPLLIGMLVFVGATLGCVLCSQAIPRLRTRAEYISFPLLSLLCRFRRGERNCYFTRNRT